MEGFRMQKFIDFVKTKRTIKGLSTYKLATLLSVSQSYLSQLENGRKDKPPSPEIIRKMSNALEIDYFELMRLAGYMNPTDSLTDNTGSDNPPYVEEEYRSNEQTLYTVKRNDQAYKIDPIDLLLKGEFPKEKLLKAIRNFKNLTFEEISRRSGLDVQYIQNVESMKVYPLDDHLHTLFHSLELEDLYNWLNDHIDAVIEELDKEDQVQIKQKINDFLRNNFTKISFYIFNVEEYKNDEGERMNWTVPKEELTERFFSLSHLLEREGNVYYEGKILSRKDREKIKILLNLVLED